MKLVLGLFILFGALEPRMASAQDVVKLARGQTLSSVMKKAGCHPGWIADIMIDSNLTLANPRKLPIGQEIVLPKNCSQSPEERMANVSAQIYMADAERGENQARSARIATLENDLKTANADRDKKENELQRIRQELVERARERDRLSVENVKLKEALLAKEQIVTRFGEWSFMDQVWLIVAFILGLGGALGINHWNLRNKEIVDHSIIVWKFGKKYTFPISNRSDLSASGKIVPRRCCPLCGENNLKDQNCGGHLDDIHYAQVYIEDLEAA